MNVIIQCHSLYSKGTGVIGQLTINGSEQYVLLTCNHVIPSESDAMSARFYFGYTDVTKKSSAYEGSSIFDNTSGKWFWSDSTYHEKVSRWGLVIANTKFKIYTCELHI